MLHGAPRPGVAGSELTRLLARLSDSDPIRASPASLERMGHWIGWTGAIAISTALSAPAVARDGPDLDAACREAADVRQVQAALQASIMAGPQTDASRPTDFAPYRHHCHLQQQAMRDRVGMLRQRLRDALTRQSSELARLAIIDAAMDQALAARERSLLTLVPLRLQAHFERLQRAGPVEAPTLQVFRQGLQQTLCAELSHHLLPVQGLLETLWLHRTS
jgi:hypothetical protein